MLHNHRESYNRNRNVVYKYKCSSYLRSTKLFCLLLFFCSNFICFLSFCLAQNSRITLIIIYIIYMYILYACLAALCELWVVLYNMLLLLNVIWNLSMRNVDQVHTHIVALIAYFMTLQFTRFVIFKIKYVFLIIYHSRAH